MLTQENSLDAAQLAPAQSFTTEQVMPPDGCHYVPRGTVELSRWYSTPFRFNRQLLLIPAASGGGPCGTAEDGRQAPH